MRFSAGKFWQLFATSSSRPTVASTNVIVTVLLLFIGYLVNTLTYGSMEPLLVAVLFLLAGLTCLQVTPSGGRFEIKMFVTVFSVGWFMAGIAAVYANHLNDPGQNFSDAASFFELSRGDSYSLGIEEIKVFTEGAGAVALWRAIYDFFSALGFEKGRYVGVLFNVFTVAIAGVFAVKMARHLYGDDASRLNRLILMFTFCGMFWLFAAIHLRDAAVLLSVTVIAFLWTRYLACPDMRSLVFLIVGSVIGFAFLGLLRTEFILVPFAMLFAGLTAISIFRKTQGLRKLITIVLLIFTFLIAGVVYLHFQDEPFSVLTRGQEVYLELSEASSSADSLGMAMIVEQAFPVRLALGAAYLFIFPIPFWTGLQMESAYNLFKSFNALFFYILIPLIAVSIIRIFRIKAVRTPALMFHVFLISGITMAIAGTSLETRHLGTFLVPVFLVALSPDLRIGSERLAFKRLSLVFLSIMAVVHIAWAALKFL